MGDDISLYVRHTSTSGVVTITARVLYVEQCPSGSHLRVTLKVTDSAAKKNRQAVKRHYNNKVVCVQNQPNRQRKVGHWVFL